jgi:hypothetical protein
MGEPAPFFLLSLALADPEQSAKGLQMKINYTNDNGQRVTWEKFKEETKEKSLCGACGQYYDEAQQGEDGYHSSKLCDANDEVFKYEGKIRFTTDKQLTERELQQLIFAIEVQIEEPADSNGNDEEFTTSTVLVELEAK